MGGWIDDDVSKGPSQFSFKRVLAKLIITFYDNGRPGKKK